MRISASSAPAAPRRDALYYIENGTEMFISVPFFFFSFYTSRPYFSSSGAKGIFGEISLVQGSSLIGAQARFQKLRVVADKAQRLSDHVLVVRQRVDVRPGRELQRDHRPFVIHRVGELVLQIARPRSAPRRASHRAAGRRLPSPLPREEGRGIPARGERIPRP